jgi:hypothetical protein
MPKYNLIKTAGNKSAYSLWNYTPIDRRWSRQTIYYTQHKKPILMTPRKKFVADTPSGRKNYRPQAKFVVVGGKFRKVIEKTPLPAKLRSYLKQPVQPQNYVNSNKANLYSIKRLTEKQLKQKKVTTALKAISALPENLKRPVLYKAGLVTAQQRNKAVSKHASSRS